MTEGPIFKYS